MYCKTQVKTGQGVKAHESPLVKRKRDVTCA